MSGQSVRIKTYRVTTPTWFPASIAVTGTISTVGVRVTGIGTLFLTELSVGDWLVNTNGNEGRKIMEIYSDTDLMVEVAFTGDPLPGATVVRIKDKSLKYLKVVFTTNDGNMKGITQASNAAWPFGIPWKTPSYDDFIEPQLVTPGGGGASVIEGI